MKNKSKLKEIASAKITPSSTKSIIKITFKSGKFDVVEINDDMQIEARFIR